MVVSGFPYSLSYILNQELQKSPTQRANRYRHKHLHLPLASKYQITLFPLAKVWEKDGLTTKYFRQYQSYSIQTPTENHVFLPYPTKRNYVLQSPHWISAGLSGKLIFHFMPSGNTWCSDFYARVVSTESSGLLSLQVHPEATRNKEAVLVITRLKGEVDT